ncbi:MULTISPECIES: hypothetical protein [Dyella]|uniref:Uncharacterized protein n=1 Tax=Dyella soli TaxID=522319 RepID=A0A4R0YE07_9GAMM|nr:MULTISPECIES: hypothetical protein [Dyella]TCI06203.1 hypothetical protein EZM97_35390 [Dyella soli]
MIIGIVFAALLAAASPPQSGLEYRYVNFATPQSFNNGQSGFVIDMVERGISAGHTFSTFRNCERPSDYVCLWTNNIHFVVPKDKLYEGRSWISDGDSFHVLGEGVIRVLGVSRRVWFIASRQEFYNATFSYSDDLGLLAMKFTDRSTETIEYYFVEGQKGFPK